MHTLAQLRTTFAEVVGEISPENKSLAELVFTAQNPEHGDYQFNGVMGLAKALGSKPRDLAETVASKLKSKVDADSISIGGPGFINIKLSANYLTKQLKQIAQSDKLAVEPIKPQQTMVVDYSSPNVAKPLHVGHIRSTIIGAAIANIYETLGWKVWRDNHLGDWGTQFGMMIYGWRHHLDEKAFEADPIAELSRLYKLVNKQIEGDKDKGIPPNEDIAKAARLETAKLHAGDAENLALWNKFMPHCLEDLNRNYRKLGVKFDTFHGESFYDPMLGDTVNKLASAKIAERDAGAMCVFFKDPSRLNDEGKPVDRMPPAIVQKADGAFTYTTSDVACIEYRIKEYQPSLIVYVVDDRQSLHFQQVFDIAHRLQKVPCRLEHVSFGKILGTDRKPLRTRDGGTFPLEELLDEAIERSRVLLEQNNAKNYPEDQFSADELSAAATILGISAIKYIDLMQNRTTDYIFDLDKMVQFTGNTAAYLQYVYARIQSIFRKGNVDATQLANWTGTLDVTNPSDRKLALVVTRFGEALDLAAADFRPSFLATYLYDLASAFSSFFHDCKVLTAETPELKQQRLFVCQQVARTIKAGLAILGIQTVERM